jgi:hypothetical protein
MYCFKADWAMVACAVTGRIHISENLPCQDKTYSVCKNGVNIIALADGSGSARLSHFGAEVATFKICDILTSCFDKLFNGNENDIKKQILSELLNSLSKKAEELKCELEELASTLMVVGVKDDRFILFHVGDGIVGYTKDRKIGVLSTPKNGEFINETIFLSSKNTLEQMKFRRDVLNGIDGFLLLSDGAGNSLYHKKEKRLASVLLNIVNALRYIDPECIEAGLIESFERVITTTTNDDCSIAIMSKKSIYTMLDDKSKMDFLGVASCKAITNSDKILAFLTRPRTLKQISRHIRLKQKIAKKHILRLCKLELICIKNGLVFF